MPFERLLLLWDEFDDFVGAFRHHILNLVHGLRGLGRDAAGRLSGWMAAADDLPTDAALGDASSES